MRSRGQVRATYSPLIIAVGTQHKQLLFDLLLDLGVVCAGWRISEQLVRLLEESASRFHLTPQLTEASSLQHVAGFVYTCCNKEFMDDLCHSKRRQIDKINFSHTINISNDQTLILGISGRRRGRQALSTTMLISGQNSKTKINTSRTKMNTKSFSLQALGSGMQASSTRSIFREI